MSDSNRTPQASRGLAPPATDTPTPSPQLADASTEGSTDLLESRAPDSRRSWEAAVYATGKTLPAGCQVRRTTFVAVLLLWAGYASWSGGRHGVNGRPAVTTLAEQCGVNEKTVRRVLAVAMKAGVLVCTAHRHGGLSPAPSTYAAAIPSQQLLPLATIQSGHDVRSNSDSERTLRPVRADIAAVQSGHSYVRQPHDLITSTSSPPPEPVQAAILVALPRGGGGGQRDASEDLRSRPITATRHEPEVDAACDATLTALQPSPAAFRDCRLHRSRWRPDVVKAVAAGWSAETLAPAVTAGSWEGVKSASAVLSSRLRDAVSAGPPPVTVVSPPPKRCGTHPNSGRRPDDECAGCWSDRQSQVAWA